MRPYILAAFMLWAASADAQLWAPTQAQWHDFSERGMNLNRPDGSQWFIAGEVIKNVLTVKADIEAVSGIAADFAVLDTQNPSARIAEFRGRTLVIFPTHYLDNLGQDLDALAVTLAHEYVHILRRHPYPTTRAQESEADDLGLQWAAKAGYDPCGLTRVVALMARAWPVMPASHPSHQERGAMANEYARKATGKTC